MMTNNDTYCDLFEIIAYHCNYLRNFFYNVYISINLDYCFAISIIANYFDYRAYCVYNDYCVDCNYWNLCNR